MADTVLIVEDEKELANIVAAYLKVEGFDVVIANDGEQGLEEFRTCTPSVVLLDIMLPKMDGIEVCKEIREVSDASIIMVSAKNGEMDKVIALGIGADDYVTKPFSAIEVVARVKAQARRYHKLVDAVDHTERMDGDGDTGNNRSRAAGKDEILVGKLYLNKASYEAFADKENLNLTTKEFEILCYLAESPNRVYSKGQIYEAVWGYNESSDDNSVTVYVNRIRDKLDKFDMDYIKTVWGAGYKFYAE